MRNYMYYSTEFSRQRVTNGFYRSYCFGVKMASEYRLIMTKEKYPVLAIEK